MNFVRLGLLDDLFAMVKSGHSSTVEVFKLMLAYEDETDFNVWTSISNILGRLSQLLGQTDVEPQFKKVSDYFFKSSVILSHNQASSVVVMGKSLNILF